MNLQTDEASTSTANLAANNNQNYNQVDDIEIEDDYSNRDGRDIGLHLHTLATSANAPAPNDRKSLEKIKEIGFQHLDIMASERTFDGAYTRTALNCLATGLLIYRVFGREFESIAITYMVLGALLSGVAIYRRISSFTTHDIVWRPHPSLTNAEKLHDVKVMAAAEHEEEQFRMQELHKRPYEPALTSRPPLKYLMIAASKKLQTKYESGMRVRVPIDPPPNRLPEEFFKWRESKQARKRLMMPYFVTSGTVVLFMGVVVIITEVIILGFILTLTDPR